MTARHYHVGANTPGYLPEGDVYTVSTKKEAQKALAQSVREYREQQYDLPLRQRRTARGQALEGYVHMQNANDPFDLGIAFWWNECTDDCEQDGAES